jgi:hypothetical protein
MGPLDYSFGIEWLVQEAAAVVLRRGAWTASEFGLERKRIRTSRDEISLVLSDISC